MRFHEVPKDGLPVIQARDHIEKVLRLNADVVVIGSGAGGAVMAFELARQGRSVIVLESGRYVPSAQMHEDMAETIQRSYVDGALQVNTTFDVPVFQGTGIGGSTVIDAGAAFRAPDYVLQHWATDLGLKALAPERLRPFYEKVERRLSVHVNEPHEINECANKVVQGCEDLGWSWKPMARTVKQCALTGHCLAGCMTDRKQSTLVTYLPWAAAMGARFFSDCHATQILTTHGRASGVLANVIDPDSNEIVAQMRIDAQVVVVAAGAVQTPLLLQRSGLGQQSGALGHNLYLNPFISMIGRFPQPVYGWRGALSGVYVDQFLGPHDGKILMMSGLPAPVQLLATGGLGVGNTHMAFMGDYRYYAMLQVFAQDEGQGSVFSSGTSHDPHKNIQWNLSPQNLTDLKRGIAAAARIFFAAGASAVRLPTFQTTEVQSVFELDQAVAKIHDEPMGMYSLRVASLQPQGTCRMGTDPFSSVVDEVCEMHDLHGLFIVDASVLPQGISVPPKMTIAAIASYVADHIEINHRSYFWS